MKENCPLISILVPVYNSGQYLNKCLDSVVNQTYRPIQIVIIDDGSTDDSLTICKEYASKYPYVEVSSQRNSGVAVTRNNLLKKIKGEYFIFIDSDDWIEPDMIQSLVKMTVSANLDIAVCSKVVENGTKGTEIIRDSDNVTIWDKKKVIEQFIIHKDLNGSLWNKLIRTEVANGISFNPNVSYGEDALFLWECLGNVNSLGKINSTFYHYRMNPCSISHAGYGPKMKSSHLVWQSIYATTKSKWPEYENIARASFAVCDFWLLYFAAINGCHKDDDIRQYLTNLKSNYRILRNKRILSVDKQLFARLLILNYKLASLLIRLFPGKNK